MVKATQKFEEPGKMTVEDGDFITVIDGKYVQKICFDIHVFIYRNPPYPFPFVCCCVLFLFNRKHYMYSKASS